MLTEHIRKFCQVSPGPLPHSVCGPGYEAYESKESACKAIHTGTHIHSFSNSSVSAHVYPAFKLSDDVHLLAKNALRE